MKMYQGVWVQVMFSMSGDKRYTFGHVDYIEVPEGWSAKNWINRSWPFNIGFKILKVVEK